MGTITLLLKAILLGWFLSSFEPLQELIGILKKRISDRYFAAFYLKTALSCWKCLAFWSGLALGGFWVAAGAGLIAMIADRKINQ